VKSNPVNSLERGTQTFGVNPLFRGRVTFGSNPAANSVDASKENRTVAVHSH